MDHYIGNDTRNIFELWEHGQSDGDSTTPSVSSSAYREYMVSLLSKFSGDDHSKPALSIGCGNAFVEGLLVKQGWSIVALDFHSEAVTLAKQKGVDARIVDLTRWDPQQEQFRLAYCDGILGHLYTRADGLQRILGKIRRSLRPGASIIVSNDASQTAEEVQAHPQVPGFHWFSNDYLFKELSKAGFSNCQSWDFKYDRPLSGERVRAIVSAST